MIIVSTRSSKLRNLARVAAGFLFTLSLARRVYYVFGLNDCAEFKRSQ